MLLISHVVLLDALFATPPGDRPELQRRDELVLYVAPPPPVVDQC